MFWFSGEIEEKPPERCVGSAFIPAPRCLTLHRINKPIKEFPAQKHPSDAPASGARRGGPRGRAAVPSTATRLHLRGRGGARPRVGVGGKRGEKNQEFCPGWEAGGARRAAPSLPKNKRARSGRRQLRAVMLLFSYLFSYLHLPFFFFFERLETIFFSG